MYYRAQLYVILLFQDDVDGIHDTSLSGIEWEEFDMEGDSPSRDASKRSSVISHESTPLARSSHKNSRDSLTESSSPRKGSVGKLKIPSEMKEKLEQLTANQSANHSVR